MKKIFETDWLASQTIFYNELTGKVSQNINDVICFNNFEFDPEGLNNYLDFGYSILEQTPIKYVKFLRHSSRLIVHDNSKLEVQYLDDPVDKWIGKTCNEDDVFDLIKKSVHTWEESVEGEIVIPTSGGYDSRLLNFMVNDKSRVRAFTYGVSNDQSESLEVVYAKKLSDILGIRWESVQLGQFNSFLEKWDDLFGISTHAHGMYQIEFYNKVISNLEGGNGLLSGIYGDLWSGLVPYKENITQPRDIYKIAYTHQLHATSEACLLKSEQELLEGYYELNRERLKEWNFQLLLTARMKMILISYLVRVPEMLFSLKPFSPLLESEIVFSMLSLPVERRINRLWQKEFFQNHGLDLESMNLYGSKQNTLNNQGMDQVPLKPLNVDLLKQVIKPAYIEWINDKIGRQPLFHKILFKMHQTPKIKGVLHRLGIKEQRLVAYSAYLTLKPIENLLKKRDMG
ncbi:hypothetical protein [aff. Roholtiella sp. LEGE 12411]|uniref:hypothetical protein n=1 Tax=aff. Roholtiella sp. LEGE 12411 TaxID=1828822 RepID=UPI0018829C81|nr:hypothetical protein [aff. Roholtiella sp. LEGE 12411]MBE9037025.1 hypothetical protein [aff. Roholtiella sp. LEGE 12411]